MTKKQKTCATIVFAIYLVWLAWLVLFKLWLPGDGSFPHVRSVELIPFAPRDIELRQMVREMVWNLIVFIPLGAYLKAFCEKRRFLSLLGIGFAVSLGFEVIQFVFAIGASDVTDVIMNTAGCAIGILLFLLMKKLFKGKAVTVLNVVGTVCEAAFFAFMTMVVIAN